MHVINAHAASAHLRQHARREAGRRVIVQHRHRALQQHRARVVRVLHEVHRRAAEPHAAVKDCLQRLPAGSASCLRGRVVGGS